MRLQIRGAAMEKRCNGLTFDELTPITKYTKPNQTLIPHENIPRISMSKKCKETPLATTNLPLGYRPDPTQTQINRNRHDANDPEHLCVILVIVAEDDGKHDTAQVSGSACAARDNT